MELASALTSGWDPCQLEVDRGGLSNHVAPRWKTASTDTASVKTFQFDSAYWWQSRASQVTLCFSPSAASEVVAVVVT